ncbi:phage virion morphogenesis protein [Comamonas sp.]|uniref:phage virion morphogenesis protein n=1 Tax=Comamonas sp. TaxID=34028 RepID=UPI002584AF31|nr:phage virion morphogenesis protein [Comamonas sp.]
MAGTHIRRQSQVVGVDELARLEALLANPSDLQARLGEYLQSSTEGRFKTQTGPDGMAWQALQPRYARSKKKNKDKILTLDGHLRRIHWQPDGDDVLAGSNRIYAAIQQLGGTINKPARQSSVHFGEGKTARLFVKKKKAKRSMDVTIPAHEVVMPARPFLGISDTDEREIHAITLDWLLGR